MRMRRSVRDAWVKALRSGEYEQAQSALTVVDDDGAQRHCCLGVLTRLAMNDGLDLKCQSAGLPLDGGTLRIVEYNGAGAMPPGVVQGWAKVPPPGFDSPSSGWTVRVLAEGDDDYEDSYVVELAEANDNGASFEQIADLIENDLDRVDDEIDVEVPA